LKSQLNVLTFTLLFAFFMAPSAVKLKGQPAPGKTLAVYISGSQFSYSEDYYLPIAQFLKLGEDRSWGESEKAELLIRVGERLCDELQQSGKWDSVFFLNGEPRLAKAFLDNWEAGRQKLGSQVLPETAASEILVIEGIELSVRASNSVFIRSNRIISEKKRFFIGEMHFSMYDVQSGTLGIRTRTCMEEKYNGDVPLILDLFATESRLGNYLSRLFSRFWLQLTEGASGNCG
jgi:hypothetical protein